MNIYETTRNRGLTGIQNFYINKRIQSNTATEHSMSAIAFDVLREYGIVKGTQLLIDQYSEYFKDLRKNNKILPTFYGSAILGLSAIGFTCICLDMGKNWVDDEGLWTIYQRPKT